MPTLSSTIYNPFNCSSIICSSIIRLLLIPSSVILYFSSVHPSTLHPPLRSLPFPSALIPSPSKSHPFAHNPFIPHPSISFHRLASTSSTRHYAIKCSGDFPAADSFLLGLRSEPQNTLQLVSERRPAAWEPDATATFLHERQDERHTCVLRLGMD